MLGAGWDKKSFGLDSDDPSDITSHTMKSYHHTIVLYIRENYDDADRIES